MPLRLCASQYFPDAELPPLPNNLKKGAAHGDKYYYTNIGFYNTSYYGDPRNVMVTTRWDF